MTVAVDPTRTVVLAVGIERYDYGEKMDLPGAASEAERFARWAVASGVPAANVTLACSRLEGPGEPPDDIRTRAATRDALEDVLVDLSQVGGDLLLVFWCGHGVVNESGERALFTSDARAENRRNVLVEQMLEFLASDGMHALGRQILIFDACANFVEDMRFVQRLPRATLQAGNPRLVPQFALFAAAQGQIAKFDKIKRQATFSTAVLAWLEERVGATFPPDVAALTAHVDAVFEVLREQGELRQTPVYRSVTPYSGSTEIEHFGGGIPVPGSVQRAVRRSDMTVSQVRRVATQIVALESLATPDARRRLVHAFDNDAMPGDVNPDELLDLVARGVAEGRDNELFSALGTLACDDSETAAVRILCERQKWIGGALGAFHRVYGQQVRGAFWRACRGTDKRIPHDLDEAMDMAAEYGNRGDWHAPLYRFVAAVEHSTGERVADTWYELPADRLNALREEVSNHDGGRGRLVVDLRNPGVTPFQWPARIVGYLRAPGNDWSRQTIDCEANMSGVKAAIAELIDWAHSLEVAKFTLGLIAPRVACDALPEAWVCGSGDDYEEPLPLWHEYPTVLHSAERLSGRKASAWWRQKVTEIHRCIVNEPPRVVWIEPAQRDDPSAIRAAVRDDADAACFGLAFAPGEHRGDLKRDPVIATVVGGAPYVFWTATEPLDWDEAKRQLVELVSQGDFDELPERLHSLRSDQSQRLREIVRLIWDEPDALPPIGRLVGIST
jgi:vWA-MoxR associated protein C-terminal domain/Caspase domain